MQHIAKILNLPFECTEVIPRVCYVQHHVLLHVSVSSPRVAREIFKIRCIHLHWKGALSKTLFNTNPPSEADTIGIISPASR